jgi:DNA-binding winged helix-turn-helix (wHTH) protein
MNTTVNKRLQVLGASSDQRELVETIRRKGYSFVAIVQSSDKPMVRPVPQSPRPAGPAPAASEAGSAEHAESKASFFRAALTSRWFTAGVVSLIVASMLFGAALVLYAHR